MRVGSELKAARKKAGISLDVIAKRTKVKVDKLVALERADFKNLPDGFYLFSMVRAYAHEVHIDPEPIVAGLRSEFAEKDAMDALHALDAAGALSAKKSNATGSMDGRAHLLRNGAVAVGIVLMTGVGAGAGVYLYRVRAAAVPEIRSTTIVRVSQPPTLNVSETPTTPAPAIDAPQDTTRTAKPKSRAAARKKAPQEPEAPSEERADNPANAAEVAPAP
jgi:cytoskeletal protein RodZ